MVTEKISEITYYINIIDYGACPNSGLDDTEVFERALSTGKSIYIPAGKYIVSRTLKLINQNLCGENICSTRIESVNKDVSEPVIAAGRSTKISDISIGFDNGIITGNEKQGERVGLLTGCNDMPLQRGSLIQSVQIKNVGTGIFSDNFHNSESFSVTYDTLEICDFSYRGIDFIADNRTGNVFNNIYITSCYDVDTLFSLDTEESEVTINQLNVEHTRCRYAIRLVGIRALAASTIHIEGISFNNKDSAFIFIENTTGSIESLSVYYSVINYHNLKLFEIGDSVYDIKQEWAWFYPSNLGCLRIGTLHLKGLNDPAQHIYSAIEGGLNNRKAFGFKFFARRKISKGKYRVCVDNYIWYSFKDDIEIYEEFPVEGNIEFISKGKIERFGPTNFRPFKRLCSFYSHYYDTDIKAELIWDGNNWVRT